MATPTPTPPSQPPPPPAVSRIQIERYVSRIVMLFAESAFYGGFFVLFIVSTFLLLRRRQYLVRRRARVSEFGGKESTEKERRLEEERGVVIWMGVGGGLFLLVTLHWVLIWAQEIAIPARTKPGAPPSIGISQTAFFRLFFECVTFVYGDIVVLTRLWTISNRKKQAIVPAIVTLIGFVVSSIIALVDQYSHYFRHTPTAKSTRWWFFGMMLSNFCFNLYATALISWKIMITKGTQLNTIHDYSMNAASIAIESVALPTFWMLLLLVSVVVEPIPMAWSYLLQISAAVYGLALMMISVRMGLGWTKGPGGAPTSRSLGAAELVFVDAHPRGQQTSTDSEVY